MKMSFSPLTIDLAETVPRNPGGFFFGKRAPWHHGKSKVAKVSQNALDQISEYAKASKEIDQAALATAALRISPHAAILHQADPVFQLREGHHRCYYVAEQIESMRSYSKKVRGKEKRELLRLIGQLEKAYEMEMALLGRSTQNFGKLYIDRLSELQEGEQLMLLGGSSTHATIYILKKESGGTFSFKVIDAALQDPTSEEKRGVERIYQNLSKEELAEMADFLYALRHSLTKNPTEKLDSHLSQKHSWRAGRSFGLQTRGDCVSKSVSIALHGELRMRSSSLVEAKRFCRAIKLEGVRATEKQLQQMLGVSSSKLRGSIEFPLATEQMVRSHPSYRATLAALFEATLKRQLYLEGKLDKRSLIERQEKPIFASCSPFPTFLSIGDSFWKEEAKKRARRRRAM